MAFEVVWKLQRRRSGTQCLINREWWRVETGERTEEAGSVGVWGQCESVMDSYRPSDDKFRTPPSCCDIIRSATAKGAKGEQDEVDGEATRLSMAPGKESGVQIPVSSVASPVLYSFLLV